MYVCDIDKMIASAMQYVHVYAVWRREQHTRLGQYKLEWER